MSTTTMTRDRTFKLLLAAGALVLLAWSIPLRAQFQVNPQVNRQLAQPAMRGTTGCINFAGTPGGIQAKSSVMMGSEFKYAAWSSGASRSDIRMNYAAVGPRATGGPESYINYKPSYLQTNKSAAAPAASGSNAFVAGSIRYSNPTSATTAAAAAAAPSGRAGTVTPSLTAVPSAGPRSTSPGGMSAPGSASSAGSIRYSPLYKK